MKRSLFYFAFMVIALVFVACSDSAPATEGSEAEAPAAEAPAAAERNVNQDNPAERMLSKYQSMGLELTEEQAASVRTIAGQYDFSATTDKSARQDMRTKMQKEIMDNVLTPEQKATFEASRKKR
ncbi:MAG: hypothetical protein K9I85_01205 [Saprospiraceae bacterium]|nr:hypothetical protein [Saprospiraceae bacterium]